MTEADARRQHRKPPAETATFFLRFRYYAEPSPRCDVWLITKLGAAEHCDVFGEVPKAIAASMQQWASTNNIPFNTEKRDYVRWPIDPSPSEQYARDKWEETRNVVHHEEAPARKRRQRKAGSRKDKKVAELL